MPGKRKSTKLDLVTFRPPGKNWQLLGLLSPNATDEEIDAFAQSVFEQLQAEINSHNIEKQLLHNKAVNMAEVRLVRNRVAPNP